MEKEIKDCSGKINQSGNDILEKQSKIMLLKVLCKFMTVIPKNERTNITVSGSFALAIYGLKKFSEVKDLDIRVYNPSNNLKEILSNLELIEKPEFSTSFINTRDAGAQFNLEGISFDVFYQNEKDNQILVSIPINKNEKEKMMISLNIVDIPTVINAKKNLHRKKDLTSLLDIRNKILSDDEIYTFLK